MLKVVKMLRLPRVLKQLEELVGRAALNILSLVIIALMMMHWTACAFWFVGSLNGGSSSSNWIAENKLNEASESVKYVTAWGVHDDACFKVGSVACPNRSRRCAHGVSHAATPTVTPLVCLVNPLT